MKHLFRLTLVALAISAFAFSTQPTFAAAGGGGGVGEVIIISG